MMYDFSYIHGREMSDAQLHAILKHDYVCPWCERARIFDRRYAGVSGVARGNVWVETPLQLAGQGWICLGCYIDVYTACNSFDFSEHPDRALVESIAKSNGLLLDEFRRRAWVHQLEIINADREASKLERGAAPLEQRLKRLMLGEA